MPRFEAEKLKTDKLVDLLTGKFVSQVESRLPLKFKDIESFVDPSLLDSLMGHFKYLKNHFRSIYVDAEGEERGVIRATTKRLVELSMGELFPQFAATVNMPKIAQEFDADLYLLRKNEKVIQKDFTPSQKSTLKSFLTSFINFEEAIKQIEPVLQQKGVEAKGSSLFDIIYSYIYWRRCYEEDRRFQRGYKTTVKEINSRLKKSYHDLAEAIKQRGKLIDYQGDYLFVAINQGNHMDIPWLHPVRKRRKYIVGDFTEAELKHPKLAL